MPSFLDTILISLPGILIPDDYAAKPSLRDLLLNAIIEKRVAQLLDNNVKQLLKGRRVGLEKESLRVADDGFIAQTPHPSSLGSTLTHPSITTDY